MARQIECYHDCYYLCKFRNSRVCAQCQWSQQGADAEINKDEFEEGNR